MTRSRSRSVGLQSPEPGPSTPRSPSRRSATPTPLSPRAVVTVPPWARDESPSPGFDDLDTPGPNERARSSSRSQHPNDGSNSYFASWDQASTISSTIDRPGSRWWVFTRPRRGASNSINGMTGADARESSSNPFGFGGQASGTPGPPIIISSPTHPGSDAAAVDPKDPKGKAPERIPMRERFKSTVLSAADSAERWRNRQRLGLGRQVTVDGTPLSDAAGRSQWAEVSPITRERERDSREDEPSSATLSSTLAPSTSRSRPLGEGNALRLELPPSAPPTDAFTMSQSKTPGWQSPWMPHPPMPHRTISGHEPPGIDEEAHTRYEPSTSDSERHLTPWGRRVRSLRRFILHSDLTPLILRLCNLALTTTTLGIAVEERLIEKRHHVLGVIGSSITVNIMFAPLTIVHVLLAIYLEYFGRPLGLWRTSSKLFYTLLETVFICLWSAALSLTADNYFTSGLRCSPISSTRWWNQLPSADNPLGVNVEGSLSDDLCTRTLALVFLVFAGNLTYILSLGVSLFRIFEKVKFHGANTSHSRTHF